MSATIISFINFKGGVGKTALTVNLAISLAYHFGEKVLIIDLDPQSNASIQLMNPMRWRTKANNTPPVTVYGLLTNQNPIGPCIVNDVIIDKNGMIMIPKIHLIPSCYKLMDFEHFQGKEGQEPHYVFFWKQIMSCIDLYDFILIDCPPNLYKTTQCGIFCSHYAFIPCNPDALSLVGLSLLADKIHSFKQRTESIHYKYREGEKQIQIAGIIFNNKPTVQKKANKAAEAEFRKKLQELKMKETVSSDAKILPISVRQAADFRTGSFSYKPLLFMKPKNKGLITDYRNLANEIRQNYRSVE